MVPGSLAPPRPEPAQRRWAAALRGRALLGCALLGGVLLAGCGGPAAAGDRPAARPSVTLASREPVAPAPAARSTTSPPVGLRIPALGVDTTLEQLHVDATGALAAPVAFDRAGWFADGALPGDIGPAVIAGHVDSATGPAVFYRLSQLIPGAEVDVLKADGSRSVFVTDRTVRAAKDAFPTDAVYGPTPLAELRLITCGGAFDRTTGHYLDNVIVFAQLRR